MDLSFSYENDGSGKHVTNAETMRCIMCPALLVGSIIHLFTFLFLWKFQ